MAIVMAIEAGPVGLSDERAGRRAVECAHLARLQHWALEDLAARLPRASLGEPRHQRLMHVRRNRETLRSARVPGQLPRLQQCHQVLGFLQRSGKTNTLK